MLETFECCRDAEDEPGVEDKVQDESSGAKTPLCEEQKSEIDAVFQDAEVLQHEYDDEEGKTGRCHDLYRVVCDYYHITLTRCHRVLQAAGRRCHLAKI